MHPCYTQMCLKCLNNFSSESSRSKTKKKNHIFIYPQTIFEVQSNVVLTSSIDFVNIDTENSMQENCPRLD